MLSIHIEGKFVLLKLLNVESFNKICINGGAHPGHLQSGTYITTLIPSSARILSHFPFSLEPGHFILSGSPWDPSYTMVNLTRTIAVVLGCLAIMVIALPATADSTKATAADTITFSRILKNLQMMADANVTDFKHLNDVVDEHCKKVALNDRQIVSHAKRHERKTHKKLVVQKRGLKDFLNRGQNAPSNGTLPDAGHPYGNLDFEKLIFAYGKFWRAQTKWQDAVDKLNTTQRHTRQNRHNCVYEAWRKVRWEDPTPGHHAALAESSEAE